MDFQPTQVDLVQELSEYLTRGAGVYSVDDSKNQILSVTTSAIEKSDMPDHNLYTLSIHYVKMDESRGVANYVIVPGRVALLEFQAVSLDENESLEEKIQAASEALKARGAAMNSETTSMWANSLVSYLSLGGGLHSPTFVDSAMGMISVKVQWYVHPETRMLYNFGGSEQIIYLCQVAYETDEPTKSMGSVLFRVVPQSLF